MSLIDSPAFHRVQRSAFSAIDNPAEELFAALPRPYRDHIGDLPRIVALLESHAGSARACVEEIEALMSIGDHQNSVTPAPNLVAARESAKRELGNSVAALEAIRLDLLRLHGGASDLRPITTMLEAARSLSQEMEPLERAQREVSAMVRPLPLDLQAHTPV